MADDNIKTCSSCGRALPYAAFHRDSRRPGRYRSRCKTCIGAENRRWYDRNTERKLSVAKVWRQLNAERMRSLIYAWFAENAARHRLNCTRWQRANREKCRAYTRAWHHKNIDRNTLKAARYRARKHGAQGDGWRSCDVHLILKAQRGRCALCRVDLLAKFHRDHIIPLSKGGAHDRRNLQLLCAVCNLSKGARDPIDHARSLGLLI